MSNQLEIIVKESGLETTKAQYILDKFKNYFSIAAEWEKKARDLIVTDDSQTAEMQMARTGRLFLKEKRVAIEKARKELKEQALREGKAIDGIANVLKGLIVPIEEYLEKQERFVEIQEEQRAEAKRIEIERRIAEEERLAAEKAAQEQERIRFENERLKKEAEERERKIAIERKKQEEVLAKERAKAEAEKKAIEEKNLKERQIREQQIEAERKKKEEQLARERALREEAEKKAREEREAAEKKKAKEAEIARKKLETERQEKERLAELLKNQIECPKCHFKFQLKRGDKNVE